MESELAGWPTVTAAGILSPPAAHCKKNTYSEASRQTWLKVVLSLIQFRGAASAQNTRTMGWSRKYSRDVSGETSKCEFFENQSAAQVRNSSGSAPLSRDQCQLWGPGCSRISARRSSVS